MYHFTVHVGRGYMGFLDFGNIVGTLFLVCSDKGVINGTNNFAGFFGTYVTHTILGGNCGVGASAWRDLKIWGGPRPRPE